MSTKPGGVRSDYWRLEETGEFSSDSMLKIIYWSMFALILTGTLFAANVPADVPERINASIGAKWQEYGVRPAARATDGEWLRRVYLDVLGRIPTTHELFDFQKGSGKRKRQELARRILRDEAYQAEFARNWATIWTNILIGRNGGNERNSLTNRDGMRQYLTDAFARNHPFDAMVLDLLTAEGNNKPGLEDYNGAVNFLAMKLGDKAAQATADVSRIFLGKQLQCTQCHNHPFNDWKQNQFWELNSFFRQTVPLRRFNQADRMVSHVYLTDQDFAGEGNTPEEAEVYFEVRDGTLQAAYPVFINGEVLSTKSGFLADVNRRQELAKFIVHSEEMPRAIVNRLWAHFFNYGFTTPVDDMGPHNPATHPELLTYLAEQFEANSYDFRLLMEWIITSEPYSLSSRITKHNATDDPTKGESPLFSHYYLRQMRAEELYDSLLTATRVDRVGNNAIDEKTRERWLDQFVVAFGNDEGTEGSTFDGTITQSLVLFNGEVTKQALSDEPAGMLRRLAEHPVPLTEKVDHLFLAAVARTATKDEQLAARQLVVWRAGNVFEALQDLWWAILNSNEFILNH